MRRGFGIRPSRPVSAVAVVVGLVSRMEFEQKRREIMKEL